VQDPKDEEKCWDCGRVRTLDQLNLERTSQGELVYVCQDSLECVIWQLAADGFFKRHPERLQ
jgi:hypothetical protein